jgi:hypothetical protein
MALLNATTIKAFVDAYIKTNGMGEITGPLQNELFTNILDSYPNLIDHAHMLGLNEYLETKVYQPGNSVVFEGEIYKCNTQTSGTFEPADWEKLYDDLFRTSIDNTDDITEGSTHLWYTNARADARITAQKGNANGLAPLDGSGKINSVYLPSVAITDITPVNSQAAQLALTSDKGDVVVRTDISKNYMHNGGTTGTMADWTELINPTNPVLSVNGLIGAVSLTADNIPTGSTYRIPTISQLNSFATLTGAETLTNKVIGSGSSYAGSTITHQFGGTGIVSFNPGDLLYGDTYPTNALNKRAIGIVGNILGIANDPNNAGKKFPVWVDNNYIFQQIMTSLGDIIYGNDIGQPVRLGIGLDGQVLMAKNTSGFIMPKWEYASSIPGVLLQNGQNPLNNNWIAGNYSISARNTIIGDAAHGIYVYHGAGVGLSAAEFITVDTTGVNVTTNTGIAYRAYSTGGTGYMYSGSGTGLLIDTKGVGINANSTTTVAAFTQTGALSANNTNNAVSVHRAINRISSFLPGTMSNSAGGTTVTGSGGTTFLTSFAVGDKIFAGGETVTVTAVSANNSMTTTTWTNAHSGSRYCKVFDATGSLLFLGDNTGCSGDFITISVNNSVKARFNGLGKFQYSDGSQGNGKVLTSDTDGVASWQTVSAGTTYTFSTGLAESAGTVTVNLSTGKASGQSVIGGVNASEMLTLSSTSHSTKGKIVIGTSAYDEVNNFQGTNIVTPLARYHLVTNALGVTQTDASGILLENTTGAGSGAQQISPGIIRAGSGYATTPAAPQSVRFRDFVLPIQSSTAPNGALVFQSSINNAAWSSSIISLYNTGNVVIGSDASPTLARFAIIGGANGTTLSSPSSAQQTVLFNTDNTANNFFGYTWYGNNTSGTPMIYGSMAGQYVSHTTGSESFEYAWLTRFNNALAERLRLAGAGKLIITGANMTTANDGQLVISNTGDGSNYTEAGLLFKSSVNTNSAGVISGRIYAKWDGNTVGDQRLTITTGDTVTGGFLDTLSFVRGNVILGGNAPSNNAVRNSFSIMNGTAPSGVLTNGVQIYSSSARAMIYEDTSRFIVQAAASTKTTSGAPFTNDGYVSLTINGTTHKFMTTA